jgi:hypothetical protein
MKSTETTIAPYLTSADFILGREIDGIKLYSLFPDGDMSAMDEYS